MALEIVNRNGKSAGKERQDNGMSKHVETVTVLKNRFDGKE